jgi:hypothetical protein
MGLCTMEKKNSQDPNTGPYHGLREISFPVRVPLVKAYYKIVRQSLQYLSLMITIGIPTKITSNCMSSTPQTRNTFLLLLRPMT